MASIQRRPDGQWRAPYRDEQYRSMRDTLHDELTPSTGSTALRHLWSAELVLGEAAAGEPGALLGGELVGVRGEPRRDGGTGGVRHGDGSSRNVHCGSIGPHLVRKSSADGQWQPMVVNAVCSVQGLFRQDRRTSRMRSKGTHNPSGRGFEPHLPHL